MKQDLAIRALNMAVALRRPHRAAFTPQIAPLTICRQTVAGQRNTSTASATRAANTRNPAGNHPWPSNERPPDMSPRPDQNRDRSKTPYEALRENYNHKVDGPRAAAA